MYNKEFFKPFKEFPLTFKEKFNAENDARLHNKITFVISRRYHQFENKVAEEPVNYVISVVVAWQVLKWTEDATPSSEALTLVTKKTAEAA